MRLPIACFWFANAYFISALTNLVEEWDEVKAYYLGICWLVIGISMLLNPKSILARFGIVEGE